MSLVEGLLGRVRRMAQLIAARHRADLEALPPTLSIGFDDFPASAAVNGAPVLEEHGCRGTFYLSCGLMGAQSESGPIATAREVAALLDAGHEIGCHTHSHLMAEEAAPGAFALDLERNAGPLAELMGGRPCESFAYPFGSITLEAKRAAGARFSNCRCTWPRVNRGVADLNLLSAAPLYSRGEFLPRARGLLRDCARHGGWLILYSHDVQETPSPHGCTPAQLDEILRLAAGLGMAVAPAGHVAAALARAGGGT